MDRPEALKRAISRTPHAEIRTSTAGIIFVFFAIAVRWRVLGDPVIHIDEQYYFLVGGRLLHGAIPYVDIWDRKPIGLFLLYAACRFVGGNNVLSYQIAALFCVSMTALLIFAMAKRIAPSAGALSSGIIYIAYLNLAGGEGGQAPVFYNLPVAAAISLILFKRHRAAATNGNLRLIGASAMFLFGIALQIKYSVVFEGVFAGLLLMGFAWFNGRSLGRLTIDTFLWVGCSLTPTLCAAAYYAHIGHLNEWLFANVLSITQRRPEQADVVLARVTIMAALVAPLAFGILLRRWTASRPVDPHALDDLRVLDGWAASALLGVILFGTWFNHYALPLFVPFSVVAAPLWNRREGRFWLVLLMSVAAIWGQRILYRHVITRGDASTLTAAAATTRGAKGCIFVYDGMPAMYDATNSCFLTTRPFPAHLQALNEMGATGISEAQEVRRVMALRPERVMTMEPAYDEENLASRAMVYRALAREYTALYRYDSGGHEYVVYGLRGTTSGLWPRYDKPDTRIF